MNLPVEIAVQAPPAPGVRTSIVHTAICDPPEDVYADEGLGHLGPADSVPVGVQDLNSLSDLEGWVSNGEDHDRVSAGQSLRVVLNLWDLFQNGNSIRRESFGLEFLGDGTKEFRVASGRAETPPLVSAGLASCPDSDQERLGGVAGRTGHPAGPVAFSVPIAPTSARVIVNFRIFRVADPGCAPTQSTFMSTITTLKS